MVNGPGQAQVAQLGARGLLVQGHLDSVETIKYSARCKAISILPSSRFGHKRGRHVGCITTSRDAAVFGVVHSRLCSARGDWNRQACVAIVWLHPNNMLQLRDSASPKVQQGTPVLCNFLSRLFDSLVMIRSMSERETDQTWHNSYRLQHKISRQPIAQSGAAVGTREGPARIDRRPKARSDRRRPRVNCKANLPIVDERAKVTRIASR